MHNTGGEGGAGTPESPEGPRLITKMSNLIALLWREVLKFGAVGGLGWFIDNGIYTLLWHGPMSDGTIKARVVSTIIATLFFTADFIAGGVVGLVLATIFRFLAYRYFVFNEELGEKLQPVPSGSGPALVGAGQR